MKRNRRRGDSGSKHEERAQKEEEEKRETDRDGAKLTGDLQRSKESRGAKQPLSQMAQSLPHHRQAEKQEHITVD